MVFVNLDQTLDGSWNGMLHLGTSGRIHDTVSAIDAKYVRWELITKYIRLSLKSDALQLQSQPHYADVQTH